MLQRTVSVNHIRLIELGIASVLQIGDTNKIESKSFALAVQREEELYFGNEGSFKDPVFSEPIPLPPIQEQVNMVKHDGNPVIKVGSIRMTAASSSAVIQLGNTCHIHAEARVKHIRHLLKEY